MTLIAYVGCRTTRERNARGEGISAYYVDEETGGWSRFQVLATEENPSFLATHPILNILYSVHGDLDLVTSYSIAADGQLSLLGKQSTRGRNPVHLALDPTNRWLVIPNYKTDSLVSLPVDLDGQLQPVADLCEVVGTLGPHKVEQNYGRPHHSPFSPSGKWIVVPEKGNDQVSVSSLDGVTGELDFVYRVQARENSGPRHVAFHPSLSKVYVLNELDSTVTTYEFDDEKGALFPIDILSALPRDFCGNSRASEIEISADGRHLYTSNRGHDSITVFSVGTDGQLNATQWQSSGGKTPRFFAIDPTQRWLHVANEDSDTITTFMRKADGSLEMFGDPVHVGSPTSVVFRQLTVAK
ncbi:lactonase family protein [Rhizobium sp. AU243]|uniref:lactonase family protein n=1 Tax=Rhizobium sp. AU243 TaxID=2303425 RepID=UPI0010CCA4FC|nr:lactonase family protein [Rhizobium sp. AU243]TKV70547.1 lactonase family protein [Rhizobium sp. AU243]